MRGAALRCVGLRQSDRVNCITRVLCPTCESDRKLLPSEASQRWRFSYPRFRPKSAVGRLVCGLSTKIDIVSTQGVTRYALSSPYGQNQRYALGLLPDETGIDQGGDQPKISGGPARSKKVEKGGPYGKNAPIRGGKKVARRDRRWAPDRSGSE